VDIPNSLADSPAAVHRVAGPIAAPSGPYGEQAWWIPVRTTGSREVLLEARVYRPSGSGPFPLVTINHGVPRDESDINLRKIRLRFQQAAQWFVNRGFAVAVPLRHGFGKSEGDFAEQSGPCDSRNYIAEGGATSLDMLDVIRYMQKQTFVDARKVIVVGQSGGGLGALVIAGDAPDGVLGIISFAGSRGSAKTGTVCCETDLVSTMAILGARNRLPGIWLFSENDQYFGSALAPPLFRAYSTVSIPSVTFVRLPSFGGDGHRILYDANPELWAKPVSSFLRRLVPNESDR